MHITVTDQTNNGTDKIDLPDSIFACKINESAIYYAVINEQAKQRQGTASSKSRGEVKGSRKKLWKQKGTGRARMGTAQSPVWVGGGVAFGPKPRNYNYKISKKLKNLAFKSIISQKMKMGNLIVIEDIALNDAKTKLLNNYLLGIIRPEKTVLIISDAFSNIKRAGRNIPWLDTLSYDKLRAHNLFYSKNIVVFRSVVQQLCEHLLIPNRRGVN